MERGEKFAGFEAQADSEGQGASHLCKCGRAPWRRGQRNCVFCNREANRKYRESLKSQAARLKQICGPAKAAPAKRDG